MVLYFHFTFKPFSGHAQKRERARERERERQHGREIAPAPSTGEGEIDPHPRAPTNPENPRLSSFVKQCPNHQIVNPFLRSSSSSVEPIPQIVELVRRTHSSDHEPKSSPEIVPPNHRSTCSGSISSPIRLLSDFWVDL